MMHRKIISFILLLFLCFTAGTTAARAAEDIEKQRRDYQAARQALKKGDIGRFTTLLAQLDGYILHSHLEYEFLKNRIAQTAPEAIHRFLEENRHAAGADALRKKWLYHLAQRGDWERFLAESGDIQDDPRLYCYRLGRLVKKSEDQAALMAEIERLWLTGKRLPSACNAVFNAWRKAGHMTSEIVWERVKLAMESRRSSLASELGKYLDKGDQIWLRRWRAMHRDPVHGLRNIRYPVETPVARMIIKHGVVRLAYRDPEAAMEQWRRLKQEHQFLGEDDNYVLRWAGILAAQRQLPVALEWLSAVSADSGDDALRLWRLKAAIRAGEWHRARQFVAALTEEERNDSQWRYWKARILEETGDEHEARKGLMKLARERNYYGFLAADRVNTEYSLQHESIEVTPEEVGAILTKPGIAMARELYELGQTVSARRQWNWTTRTMNNRDLQVAAVIAGQWGWYDRAILTVSRSDHLDDLDLRFPLLYRELVEANAEENGIDPGWIYGVMRQESAFVVDARSSAGALGLMQLMPRTGRVTGRRLKLKIRSNRAILNIENNLRLGASYLKNVLQRNKGHQVLATASYNAGPNRVRKWLPETQALDADVWVDSIPLTETRNYVKNVLAYTAVYDYRLTQESTRLRERMPQIPPTE